MPSSDSEGFESADEGHNTPVKREKNRLSSSNSKASDPDDFKSPVGKSSKVEEPKTIETAAEGSEGWDDFGIDEVPQPRTKAETKPASVTESENVESKESNDTGWDDFNDWGEEDCPSLKQKLTEKPSQASSSQETKPVTGTSRTQSPPETKQAFEPPTSSGWGWGSWGVDSLLNSASAGISTLTTHVSQGINTVLETGIGAPDPEELARISASEKSHNTTKTNDPSSAKESGEPMGGRDSFQFGSLISGVTKFVETTGTKVIAGGLDTLETIGKKTMEVLQDGDPGLAKKRAMLGLDSGDKVVLSQVLREAKAKADEEDRLREEKREAKQVHYENLFDDFEGLVHLEALEMLSKQVSMRIEEKLRSADPEKRQDIKETLQQVAELCEMPEEDDDDDEEPTEGQSKSEAFHEKLQAATQDIGLKLQFQAIVNHYKEVLAWISSETVSEKATYTKGVCNLAQATALSVEIYHKTAEMLLVKTRRSTADEADALAQMTVVLTKHISDIATLFTDKLNSLPEANKEQINNYITNLFLEAGNSSTYIQNAFQLALPILQIGAV